MSTTQHYNVDGIRTNPHCGFRVLRIDSSYNRGGGDVMLCLLWLTIFRAEDGLGPNSAHTQPSPSLNQGSV